MVSLVYTAVVVEELWCWLVEIMLQQCLLYYALGTLEVEEKGLLTTHRSIILCVSIVGAINSCNFIARHSLK